MSRVRIAITFDVDMQNYVGGGATCVDELEACFPIIRDALREHPQVRTTWFLRIDSQIQALYGDAEFILHRHASVVEWLRSHGHQIGWHHHAYRFDAGSWSQETRPEIVVRDIRRFGEIARRHTISAARMGWGWQTNESMRLLDEVGFDVDSTAIPRPRYPWESSGKDWSRSPSAPYRPSRNDYQAPGAPSLSIVEVPISTTYIPAPGDSLAVQRYVNLAYRREVFDCALSGLAGRDLLVTITHPYELLSNVASHALLAFDPEALRSNLARLTALDGDFVTLEEAARAYSLVVSP